MKKILSITVLLFFVAWATFDIFASAKAVHNNMPAFLVPLSVEFAKECKEVRWKYGVGIIDENMTARLDDIRKRRDMLLKQHKIKSFKVRWEVEDFAVDGQSFKPHAHFSGWYLN